MQITALKPDNAKALIILIAGLVAVIVIVVFIQKTFGGISNMVSSIGSSLGFTDTPAQAATKAAIASATTQSASPASPWSPQYFQNAPSGATILTQAAADAIAGQIWDSVGMFSFTTDIGEAVAAIKELSTQAQVSFVAYRFNALYQKDLFSWLTLQYTKMGTPDPSLQTIVDYVNNLPTY